MSELEKTIDLLEEMDDEQLQAMQVPENSRIAFSLRLLFDETGKKLIGRINRN